MDRKNRILALLKAGLLSFVFFALMPVTVPAFAQASIKVEAPNIVGADEQFNVTFIIEGEDRPTEFIWDKGEDFDLVWGPQQGSSTSVSIVSHTFSGRQVQEQGGGFLPEIRKGSGTGFIYLKPAVFRFCFLWRRQPDDGFHFIG